MEAATTKGVAELCLHTFYYSNRSRNSNSFVKEEIVSMIYYRKSQAPHSSALEACEAIRLAIGKPARERGNISTPQGGLSHVCPSDG